LLKILLANDDGWSAPGIQALFVRLSRIAGVTLVAPDSNRSAASNSLTLDRPLTVSKAADAQYFVNGTPSDCVHVAMTAVLKTAPDLVVSGINNGQNMGDDTIYSGTVAAAMEGFFYGVPAIAFSLAQKGWSELDAAADVATGIVQKWANGPRALQLINVNIPNLPVAEHKGVRLTRLGRRHSSQPVVPIRSPQGHDVYWIGPSGAAKDGGDGTDFHALEHGFTAVTPLTADLTDRAALAAMAAAPNWLS
jgi:5'-nucleotidase